MTHTIFTIGNTNKSNNNITCPFCKHANYSKTLDSLIAANIKECNPWLNQCTGNLLKIEPANNEFEKAANFLAKYKSNKKLPFIYGKTYKLNGTPIIFYDDEIQIGFDLYSYDQFGDTLFLKALTPATKKTIITIFTSGSANISINIK